MTLPEKSSIHYRCIRYAGGELLRLLLGHPMSNSPRRPQKATSASSYISSIQT